MVDVSEGVLGLEWIDGDSVRRLLPGEAGEGEDALHEYRVTAGMWFALWGLHVLRATN